MPVSSASQTITTELPASTPSFFSTTPSEFAQCMTFNFKMLLAFSLTVLLLCLFMSCVNSIFSSNDDIMGETQYVMCKCIGGKCKCRSRWSPYH